jgi:hypothetical protein
LPFQVLARRRSPPPFDAGQISSDGGVLLWAGADKRLGLIDTLAALIPDHRDPALITHTLSDCALASSRLPAATRMPMIWMIFAKTRRSSWPAGGCRTAAMISPPTLVWLFHQLRWRNL